MGTGCGTCRWVNVWVTMLPIGAGERGSAGLIKGNFMRLRVHRTDGKTGVYLQNHARRAEVLAMRFNPATLFTTGPIVIGVLNPFSVLNADDVCWVEVESEVPLALNLPVGVEEIRKLSGRDEYQEILARQWPKWIGGGKSEEGDLMEALVEVSLRSGETLFLHVLGRVTSMSLPEALFGVAAIAASIKPHGALYINPKAVVRYRVYHSISRIDYPAGLWFAEADDI